MVEVSDNFKQECEANVGAYKFGKIKVNYIDDNPLNYEQGAYSSSSGAKTEDNQSMRSVNLVECKPSFKYKIELGNSAYKMKIITYTEAQAFIATHDNLVDGSEVTTEATAKYLSVTIYSTDILEGTSILLNGTSRNGALTGAELEGNTTQNGTPTPTTPIEVNNVTGLQVVKVSNKNLMEINNISTYTAYGITFTKLNDSSIKINGTSTASGDFWVNLSTISYQTLYGTPSINIGQVGQEISSQKQGNFTLSASITNGTIKSFSYNTNNDKTACLIDKSASYNNAILNIQLEKGNLTTYEKREHKDYEINLGKNLIKYPYANTTKTENGITFTDNGDGSITIDGTATAQTLFYLNGGGWSFNKNNIIPLGTYCFNRVYSGTGLYLCMNVYNADGTNAFYSSANGNATFNITTTQSLNMARIVVNNGFVADNIKVYPQLEKGTTPTTYAPYFEPIELNKIGTYQDFIRKGTGKNLFDISLAPSTGIISNGGFKLTKSSNRTITFLLSQYYEAGTYTISFNVTNSTLSNLNKLGVWFQDSNGNVNVKEGVISNGIFVVSPTAKFNRLYFFIYNSESDSATITTTNVQLEKGNQATYYEPYGYGDKWYIEKNADKFILDKANTTSGKTYCNVNTTWDEQNEGYIHFQFPQFIVKYNDGDKIMIADNRFPSVTIANRNLKAEQIFAHYTNGVISITIDISRLNGITSSSSVVEKRNAFNTWLTSNPIIIDYVMVNTTYTLIENEELLSQLDALSNANTQEGITNILVEGNLPATLEVERDLTDSIKGRQLKPFIGYSITGDDDLISFKITGKADSSKSFIGSCVTKQIDLEIFNAENKHNLENKQIIVSTGMAETTGNFVTFEPFTITGTKDNKTKDKISYIGYDDMYKLNTAYVDTNTYGEDGITLYSFLESLASNANTSLGNESIPNGDFVVDGNPFTNNETNMFALSQVAKLSGGFAEIGRDNKIYIKTLDQDTPTMTLDTNLYSEDFEKAENFGAVNKVVVGESNILGNEAILSDIEDIELNGEHVVEILDSYFLSDDADKQIICAELFDNLKGLYYLPFSATCNGFPYLDLGDMIQIEDKNGDTYLTYLLNYELSYSGGYKEKIGAEAQSSTETKYKNVNTIKDKFKQVEIIVDKANAQIQSIITTNEKNYTAINQTIGGISTEVQTATTTASNAMTAVGDLAQGTQQQFTDLTEALSRLSQSVNNIQALFRVTGGANLIQNSVGFFQNSSGAPTMWNVSQGIAGFKHGYDSELLGQTTSQGKFYIRNGTISTTEDDATLETEANISGIEIGSLVTLSFKYKQSADSTTTITLANGETTFFTATFSEEVEDWTSYSDADNTNSFTCTTDSLVLTITNTSTYNTDDQGFMISDLILNYGEEKTWELHSGESYGGVIQLSSQGISVKSSSANTITYMTSDGIEVFETTQGDVLGDLITKLTSNGIETKDFVATGDITTRNLITTMIKDTSNNDIYIEYIKDE